MSFIELTSSDKTFVEIRDKHRMQLYNFCKNYCVNYNLYHKELLNIVDNIVAEEKEVLYDKITNAFKE